MKRTLKSVAGRLGLGQKVKRARASIDHGTAGIEKVGHRDYVGGLWDEVGQLQLDFLVAHGLEPHHYLLDVGCGSLRAGVLLVPFLDAGHYLGIDKEEQLIKAGIEQELGPELNEEKQPRFVVSDAFEFEGFEIPADFAIAQSLFTHLPASIIDVCFDKLLPAMAPNGVFYATFFETDRPAHNPDEPHDHGYFAYNRSQMERFGSDHGWRPEYIGDWSHPRGQIMMRYRPAATSQA